MKKRIASIVLSIALLFPCSITPSFASAIRIEESNLPTQIRLAVPESEFFSICSENSSIGIATSQNNITESTYSYSIQLDGTEGTANIQVMSSCI